MKGLFFCASDCKTLSTIGVLLFFDFILTSPNLPISEQGRLCNFKAVRSKFRGGTLPRC